MKSKSASQDWVKEYRKLVYRYNREQNNLGLGKGMGWIDFEMQEKLEDFISRLLTLKEREVVERIRGMKAKISLEEPRLFQTNSERNEMGGYSSVPFYCSLCGMSEMNIQDNMMGDGNYHCDCSVWNSPTGGKWVKWYNKAKAVKLNEEFPCEENIRNQVLGEIVDLLNTDATEPVITSKYKIKR